MFLFTCLSSVFWIRAFFSDFENKKRNFKFESDNDNFCDSSSIHISSLLGGTATLPKEAEEGSTTKK